MCMYACIHIDMCVCMYMYMRICMDVYMCVCVCACMCMCTYTSIVAHPIFYWSAREHEVEASRLRESLRRAVPLVPGLGPILPSS